MILRIAATVNAPLRQENALLLAGYAPAWAQRDLTEPDLTMVNSALDFGQNANPFRRSSPAATGTFSVPIAALSLIPFLTSPSSAQPGVGPVNQSIWRSL